VSVLLDTKKIFRQEFSMNITGRTKITGLFGHPVEHTLSPAMHNAAFSHLGLDYCYLPFVVRPESLGKAVDSVRALNLAGVNVTVPHKEAVIRFLDEVNEEASFIGAVNTVVNREGRLTGYNTDGRGFMRSLEENGIEISGKRLLIVGAGGASRAIGYYLSEKAKSLSIHDIDKNKLSRLVSDLSQIRKNVTEATALAGLDEFDIFVNAVSGLSSDQTVCDLIYKKTALLEAAAEKGCRTMDGLGMLLWQGVLAFELWTSVFPPVDIMREALQKGIR
jgi:shikimate dehydrogenase